MRTSLATIGFRAASAWWSLALAILLWPTPGVQAAEDGPPLPEEVKLIVHFDLDRLRDSELYAEAAEHVQVFAKSDEKLQMFLQATGLTDMADALSGFTLYSFADAENPQDFAGVVKGAFPDETMRRLERAYAPVAREVDGRVIMPVIQTPDVELVMSFLGGGRLAFGTAEAVERVVDSRHPSANLAQAFERTESRRPIWGLIDAQGTFQAALAASEQVGEGGDDFIQSLRDNPALKSLKAISFSVDIGRDVFFEMRALTSDNESSRLLADAVKGMLALGQMGVSQVRDPDLYEFFRQVVAETEGDSVYVSFSVGPAQMERLRALGDPLSEFVPQ